MLLIPSVKSAIDYLRYRSISNWSPWQLVGKDTYIDLLQMRHAMLDQDLNRIEQEVADTCTKAKLNPDPVIPNGRSLQLHIGHIWGNGGR